LINYLENDDLGRVAHAKTEFDKVIRSFKSQVAAEFEVPSQSLENEHPYCVASVRTKLFHKPYPAYNKL
jgi:hypothetical protein